ncbi:hypothetical protein [Prevotella nigrescens]|nr:hypothetical protein [Prevotella nigrescens]
MKAKDDYKENVCFPQFSPCKILNLPSATNIILTTVGLVGYESTFRRY